MMSLPAHLTIMTAYGYNASMQASWCTFGKSFNLTELVEGYQQYGLPGMYRLGADGAICHNPGDKTDYRLCNKTSHGDLQDWNDQMDKTFTKLKPHLVSGALTGIFMGDEYTGHHGLPFTQFETWVNYVAAFLEPLEALRPPKARAAGKLMLYYTEADTATSRWPYIPRKLTHFSLDDYHPEWMYPTRWVKAAYERWVYPKLGPDTKLLVVPPAYGSDRHCMWPNRPSVVCTNQTYAQWVELGLGNLSLYRDWAANDTRIVGFDPWPLTGFGDNTSFRLGLGEMPELLKAYTKLGQAVRNNTRESRLKSSLANVAPPATLRAAAPSLATATDGANQQIWFANYLTRFAAGQLYLSASDDGDNNHDDLGSGGRSFHSGDEGKTWSEIPPTHSPWESELCLPPDADGQSICMSYRLRRVYNGSSMHPGIHFTTLRATASGIEQTGAGNVSVSFPAARAPENSTVNTFNQLACGPVIELKPERAHGMRYLSTLYGNFASGVTDTISTIVSDDGLHWQWQSIAVRGGAPGVPHACSLPSENSMVRLGDGSLWLVFRSLGTDKPLCSSISHDEGATWSVPVALPGVGGEKGPWGVMPRVVRTETGKLVLTAGRHGIWVWTAEDPPTNGWASWNLAAHHNKAFPDKMLTYSSDHPRKDETTSYTGLVALGGNDVLVSYDKLANGWSPTVNASSRSAIFTVRVTVA